MSTETTTATTSAGPGPLQDALEVRVTPSKVKTELSHMINGTVEKALSDIQNKFKEGETMRKLTRDAVRSLLTKDGNAQALSLIQEAEEAFQAKKEKAEKPGKDGKVNEVPTLGASDEYSYYANLFRQLKRRTCQDTASALAATMDYVIDQMVEHTKANAAKNGCKFLCEEQLLQGVESLETYCLFRNLPTFHALWTDFHARQHSTDANAMKDFGYKVDKDAPKYPLSSQCRKIIKDVSRRGLPEVAEGETAPKAIKIRDTFHRFLTRVVTVELFNVVSHAVNIDIQCEDGKTANVRNVRKVLAIISHANGGDLVNFNAYLDKKLEKFRVWNTARNEVRDAAKKKADAEKAEAEKAEAEKAAASAQ